MVSHRQAPRFQFNSMGAMRAYALLALITLLLAPLGARGWASETTAVDAVPDSFQGGRVPLRIVGGHLVVRCDMSTPQSRIAAHLLVDFENPCGLALHNAVPQKEGLAIDKYGHPITLHFPGFRIVHRDGYSLGTRLYDQLTKDYAVELGETAIVGTLGAEFLSRYHIVLDVGNGYMELSAPKAVPTTTSKDDAKETHENEGARPVGEPLADDEVEFSLMGHTAWLPARLDGRKIGALLVGTAHTDSRLAPFVTRMRRKNKDAALAVGALSLDELGEFLVGEPVDYHPDRAVGVMGLNHLRHIRLELDYARRRARLGVSRPPKNRDAERDYFRAIRAETPDAWLAFLAAHPKSPRRARAAEYLVEALKSWGTDDPKQLTAAVKHYAETRDVKRRTSRLYDLMREFRELGWNDAAIKAGEAGLKKGAKDLDPNAIHKIHAVLGEMQLAKDDGKKAWKHLLSAAFGMPEDGLVNLLLGRFYESKGLHRRAFSRYIQATTDAASGPQALVALEALQRRTGKTMRLSADTIERATAGKVKGFGAPDEFEADEKTDTNRCVLLENFTCAHGRPTGDWVIDGVLTHYPRKRVAVVSHHLPNPAMEPLITKLGEARAAFYENDASGIAILNGERPLRIGGRPREVAKIYAALKPIVSEPLADASKYTFEVKATVDTEREGGPAVVGSVTLKGPKANNLRVHILLVEQGVVFPGRSKVIVHRMVARTHLTEQIHGDAYKPEGKANEQSFSFDKALAPVGEACEAYVASQKERGAVVSWRHELDPEQLQIVAFVQDAQSRAVLQAVHYEMNVETKKARTKVDANDDEKSGDANDQ